MRPRLGATTPPINLTPRRIEMTAIILLMLLSDNSNGPLLDGGFRVGQNGSTVVRPADRPVLNRLSRPFRRNR